MLFQNPHTYIVSLVGPDGQIIKVQSKQVIDLPEYFKKYEERGFIRVASNAKAPDPVLFEKKAAPKKQETISKPAPIPALRKSASTNISVPIRNSSIIRHPEKTKSNKKPVAGQVINISAQEILESRGGIEQYPISNNIGVGILACNRPAVLDRLLKSIIRHTDLNKTTVFIADDASDDQNMIRYLDQLSIDSRFTIIRGDKRLGVAGNSNRLLRCLKRFKYGFLLNDDVEILSQNWEHYYVSCMVESGLHHLVYRKPGVYNAERGVRTIVNGIPLYVVKDKPHGSFLAFTNNYLKTVGAFNRIYGIYGCEHVDWSMRGAECFIQPEGFYDAVDSNAYVDLHHEESIIQNKSELLKSARQKFAYRKLGFIDFDADSIVPVITYTIPFREQERTKSLKTVINNIRAQRFPEIEIILCEQDSETRIDLNEYEPFNYERISNDFEHLFNKSMAFNKAASISSSDKLIMHDADLLASSDYTKTMFKILDKHSAAHLGATVIYAGQVSTEEINHRAELQNPYFDRVVGYYEGGSFGIKKSAFFDIGGYNEEFYGYGNEDTEFYSRMKQISTFISDRTYNFIHLHHGRVQGWVGHHNKNKELEESFQRMPMPDRLLALRRTLKKRGYI